MQINLPYFKGTGVKALPTENITDGSILVINITPE
jgi:hypothetical protein